MKNKVILGLSGGVDSAVSAYLLKKQGYDVIGLYCVMHEHGKNGIAAAEHTAAQLGIGFETADLSGEFEDNVISCFINEYRSGRTPNPCFICNPTVKFKALTDVADRFGADFIATGHYADISNYNGRYCIKMSCSKKDQSYILAGLGQDVLSKLILPLSGFYDKESVRTAAREAGLTVHSKKDSQENCFIVNEKYTDFIIRRTGRPEKGPFVLNGEKVGEHGGIIFYTVGQKKGLGLSLGKAVYIERIDPKENTIYLSEDPALESKSVVIGNLNFQAVESINTPVSGNAKIRYTAGLAGSEAVRTGPDSIKIVFDEPQRAATAGQAAVMYDHEGRVLFSGIIK